MGSDKEGKGGYLGAGRPISFQTEIQGESKATLGHDPYMRFWNKLRDVEGYIRAYGDKDSRKTAWKVSWAYYFLAYQYRAKLPSEHPKWMSGLPDEYGTFKQERQATTEDPEGSSIELNQQQTQTLKWALNTVEIPFDLEVDEKGATQILLDPIEKELEGLGFARTAYDRRLEREREDSPEPFTVIKGHAQESEIDSEKEESLPVDIKKWQEEHEE